MKPTRLKGPNSRNPKPSPHPVYRWSQLLALVLLALACVSCREEPSLALTNRLPAEVIARVGSSTISLEQFQTELDRRSRVTPGPYHSPEGRQALLDEMILAEVLHQRARAAGYESNPEIVASLKRMMVRKFEQDQVGDRPPAAVTEEEVAAYYQNHPEEFSIPEQRLGAVIFLRVARTASPELAAERRSEMEAIRVQSMEEESQGGITRGFGLLAQRNSEDQATRYRGGEMGWLTVSEAEARWGAPVAEALFALPETGGITPIVETADGLYLLKAADIRPVSLKPIEEVREGMRYRLAREKEQQAREAFHAAQRARVPVEINLASLEAVALPAPRPEPHPPAVPGT